MRVLTTYTRDVEDDKDEISLALINDYPVVVEGLKGMLEQHPRLTVTELDSGQAPGRTVDVVLYDAFAARERGKHDVTQLLDDPRCLRVVMYSWHVEGKLVDEALALGMHGFLSKEMDARELGDALVRIHEGERVVHPEPARDEITMADWPGRAAGLSPREAEVVALITQGATNEEGMRLASEQMAGKLNHDPDLCRMLIPTWEMGCRRITPGPGYLESFLLPNCHLTDSGITRVSETAVHTADGQACSSWATTDAGADRVAVR